MKITWALDSYRDAPNIPCNCTISRYTRETIFCLLFCWFSLYEEFLLFRFHQSAFLLTILFFLISFNVVFVFFFCVNSLSVQNIKIKFLLLEFLVLNSYRKIFHLNFKYCQFIHEGFFDWLCSGLSLLWDYIWHSDWSSYFFWV